MVHEAYQFMTKMMKKPEERFVFDSMISDNV